MTDLATIGIKVDYRDVVQSDKALDRLGNTGAATERQVTKATDSINSGFRGLVSTVGILGAAMTALTAGALAKYTDSATKIENQLKTVTTSTDQLAASQDRLLKVANDSRSSYESTVELYTQLTRSTTELGISQERMFNITQTINRTFAASGKSAQEASGAIRQLAQGLAAGALRGDEFNSVAENAPDIMRAIAQETGMTTGQLREFAATGGITSELLIKSLENYKETVDRVYSSTSATIEQALEVANNNTIKYVENNESLRKASAIVGESLISLSNNINAIAAAGEGAATVYGIYFVAAMGKAAVATVNKTIADVAAMNATRASTIAELESIAAIKASDAAKAQKIVTSRLEAATELAQSLQSDRIAKQQVVNTLEVLAAEQALERQRFAAQISETGRIQSATRMAGLRQAETVTAANLAKANAQLTATSVALTAANNAATAASVDATVAAGAHTAALTAVDAVQKKATVSATLLSRATAFLMGPWGLLITALGVGAAYFLTASDNVDEFGNSLDNATDKTKDFNKELENTNRIYATYIESQNKATTATLSGMGQPQLQAEFDKSSKLVEVYTNRLNDLISAGASLARIEAVRKKLEDEKFALQEIIKLMPNAKTSYEMLSEQAQKLVDRLDPATAASNKFKVELELLESVKAKGIITTAQYIKLTAALKDEFYDAAGAAKEQEKRISELDEALEAHFQAYVDLEEIQNKRIGTSEDELESMLNLVNGFDEYTSKIKETQTISEKAAERIESAFSDAWVNAFDGFESVVDGMKNAFKRLLAEMAHMALTKPIMISLGLGGLLPNAANASGISGTASGLGLLGGIGGALTSAGGFLGGSFGGGLAASGGLLSAGNFSGMFSAVGSLISSGSYLSALGAALPIAGIAAAAAGIVDKITGGGLFGTSWKEDARTINLSINGVDVSGSTTVDTSKKKSLFRGTKRSSTTTALATDELDSVFESLRDSINSAGDILGVATESFLAGFRSVSKIDIKGKTESEVNKLIQDWVSSTSEAMINGVFGDYIKQLGIEGETAGQTMERLVVSVQAVTGITKSLGLNFDLTGVLAAKAATNIIDLAGGIDALAQLSSQYYQAFYTEAERNQVLATDLAAAFASLGQEMPTTREGFRSLVDGLDLSTEAGQELFAALMQLVPSMDQYLTALEQQTLATQQAEEAIKQARVDAANEAFAAVQRAIDAEKERINTILKGAQEAYNATMESLQLQRNAIEENYSALVTALGEQKNAIDAAYSAEQDLIQSAADARIEQLNNEIDMIRSIESQLQSALSAASDLLDRSVSAEINAINAASQQRIDELNAEKSAIQEAADLRNDQLKLEASIINQRISDLTGLSGSLRSALGGVSQATAQASLKAALQAARGGNFNPAIAMQDQFSSLGGGTFASAVDAARDAAITKNRLSELSKLTDGQLTIEQRMLAATESQSVNVESQLAAIDKQIELDQENAKAQIDAINNQIDAVKGVDKSVVSLADAIKQYQDAQEAITEFAADNQVALLEQQIEKAQSNADMQLSLLEQQYNAALGIDTSVKTLTQAISDYQAAQLELDVFGYEQQLAGLTALEAIAKAQLDSATDAAAEQIAKLDEQLELAQMQINAINGVNDSILSVADAIAGLASTIAIVNTPVPMPEPPPPPPEAQGSQQGVQSGNTVDVQAIMEQVNYAMTSVAKSTASTAKSLQRIEQNGLEVQQL